MSKEKYQSNIWKSYAYDFMKNFTLFSGVLVPFFTIWGGITFAQIMILQAIFTFSMFLFEIPTGVIADRFGRKTSLILSGLVTGIAALIYASYANFWIFALGEVLWAIGSTLASGADSALVYDSLKQNNGEKKSKSIFNRIESIGLVAMMISAPLGSLVAKQFGINWAMILTSIPMFLAVVIGLSFKEPPTGEKKEHRNYFKILKTGLQYFREHRILKILTLDYVAIITLSFFLIWVYQVVLKNLNFPLEYYGFVHAGIVIAEIIVLNSIIKIEVALNSKKKYILFSYLLVGVCYLILAFSMNIYIAIACMLIIGGFGMTMKPLFYSYMNKYIESKNRATVLSAVSMSKSIVAAISNVIFGYLVDWNVKYALFGIGLIVIIFAISSKLREEHLKE
jgi:MFS family permease